MTRTRKLTTIAAAAALAVALLAGCGGDDDADATTTTTEAPTDSAAGPGVTEPGTTAPPTGDGPAVTVAGFRFDPEELEVNVGDEVTWTNTDSANHTVTADDGAFDLSLAADGGSASTTFDEAGTFAYGCSIHTSMTGTVVVTG